MTNTEIASAKNIILGTTEASAMYIGSTLIWKKGPLPSGYTLLEYILSSTNQYINLNIKLYLVLNTLYDIAIKFIIIGPGSDNSQPTLFGCLNTTSPWPGTFIRLSSATDTYVTGRYIGANVKDYHMGDKNSLIELPVKTPPLKNVYSLSNSNRTHNFGTSLFCAFSNTSNSPYRYVLAKVYYFKLFVEGVLTRDMVPCKNNNDVVGMYDLVNDVFYSSPNGTAFIAGPEI